MELSQLIEALARPDAYPLKVDAVEVRQTHISVVFLAGEHVYKVKKPVNLGFLDFSTLDKRRHFCHEEVRLNARLAAEVYLGVVPIVSDGGCVRVDAAGEPIEWAVKMRRLPDEATLDSRLERGQVGDDLVQAVARKIADFHRTAETSPRIAAFGRFDVVAANARGNFEQSRGHVGEALSEAVFARLQAATAAALDALRELVEARAARGVPRDTHGDLRLDHIYVLDEAGPELAIIDCIEFNELFRFGDPVADMAFLAMDFKYEGRGDLADALADEYFRATGDGEGRRLLAFYTAYRAAVRGKVEGFKAGEAEVPAGDRALALRKARAYWLLALRELEPPSRRPCLVLVGGLPGSGKSTLAAELAARADFHVIRSDVVRKELAGAAATRSQAASFGQGIYTDEWNQRTYAECLRLAEAALFDGRRVIVDASFREEPQRQAFLHAARAWCVPGSLLVCAAEPATVQARLAARRGDASDADWAIYQTAARAWEPIGAATQRAVQRIDTGGTRTQAVEQAMAALGALGVI